MASIAVAVGFAVRSSVTQLLRHLLTKPVAPATDLNRATDTKNITCEKNKRELAPIALEIVQRMEELTYLHKKRAQFKGSILFNLYMNAI